MYTNLMQQRKLFDNLNSNTKIILSYLIKPIINFPQHITSN